MVRKKSNRLSLIVQEGTLKSIFPSCSVYREKEEVLIWKHSITPTPLSDTYRLKLVYKRNEGVKVYVLDPKPLQLAQGKSLLPHVYSTTDQRLCLYYPTTREWDTTMLYTKTIIPWACEWLYHYEIWVGTGTWNGGGIHHETEAEKQANKIKETINEGKNQHT
jgi:hypothetical protein